MVPLPPGTSVTLAVHAIAATLAAPLVTSPAATAILLRMASIGPLAPVTGRSLNAFPKARTEDRGTVAPTADIKPLATLAVLVAVPVFASALDFTRDASAAISVPAHVVFFSITSVKLMKSLTFIKFFHPIPFYTSTVVTSFTRQSRTACM